MRNNMILTLQVHIYKIFVSLKHLFRDCLFLSLDNVQKCISLSLSIRKMLTSHCLIPKSCDGPNKEVARATCSPRARCCRPLACNVEGTTVHHNSQGFCPLGAWCSSTLTTLPEAVGTNAQGARSSCGKNPQSELAVALCKCGFPLHCNPPLSVSSQRLSLGQQPLNTRNVLTSLKEGSYIFILRRAHVQHMSLLFVVNDTA